MTTKIFLEKIFLRIENYLVLLPAFVAFMLILFADDNYCKVVLFDEYFIVSHFDAGLFWCTVLLLPLLFHYLLRKTNRRNPVLATMHVFVTVTIVFVLPYIYYHTPFIVEEAKFDFLPTPQYEQWQFKIHLAYILWEILVAIQFVFIVIAIIELSSRKPRQRLAFSS